MRGAGGAAEARAAAGAAEAGSTYGLPSSFACVFHLPTDGDRRRRVEEQSVLRENGDLGATIEGRRVLEGLSLAFRVTASLGQGRPGGEVALAEGLKWGDGGTLRLP